MVEIPCEGTTIPGYFLQPDASGQRRPTLSIKWLPRRGGSQTRQPPDLPGRTTLPAQHPAGPPPAGPLTGMEACAGMAAGSA
jgi:hypothetical protein